MDPLIDWDYYKTRAELPDDALYGVFTPLIEAASAAIRRYCRRDFSSQEYTEEFDGDNSSALFLRQTPVTAVDAVTVNGTVLDASAFHWNARGRVALADQLDSAAILWRGRFPEGVQNVSVTYTAGYAAVPADIQSACADLVTFWYNRGKNLGIASKSAGKGTTSYTEEEIPSPIRVVLNRYYNAAPGSV